MGWFTQTFEQGWPLALLGVIWLWFVPELIADKVIGSSVSRILNSVGGRSQPVRTFLPLLLPFFAYAVGIVAIGYGSWTYFR